MSQYFPDLDLHTRSGDDRVSRVNSKEERFFEQKVDNGVWIAEKDESVVTFKDCFASWTRTGGHNQLPEDVKSYRYYESVTSNGETKTDHLSDLTDSSYEHEFIEEHEVVATIHPIQLYNGGNGYGNRTVTKNFGETETYVGDYYRNGYLRQPYQGNSWIDFTQGVDCTYNESGVVSMDRWYEGDEMGSISQDNIDAYLADRTVENVHQITPAGVPGGLPTDKGNDKTDERPGWTHFVIVANPLIGDWRGAKPEVQPQNKPPLWFAGLAYGAARTGQSFWAPLRWSGLTRLAGLENHLKKSDESLQELHDVLWPRPNALSFGSAAAANTAAGGAYAALLTGPFIRAIGNKTFSPQRWAEVCKDIPGFANMSAYDKGIALFEQYHLFALSPTWGGLFLGTTSNYPVWTHHLPSVETVVLGTPFVSGVGFWIYDMYFPNSPPASPPPETIKPKK